jgi:hypothetical protein
VDLADKLQLRSGQQLRCVATPPSLTLGLAPDRIAPRDARSAALLVFAPDRDAVEARRRTVAAAVQQDRTVWVAYPKAGQLGTDLNRDVLAALLAASGVEPVRQVSIDEVWSAMRFRAA